MRKDRGKRVEGERMRKKRWKEGERLEVAEREEGEKECMKGKRKKKKDEISIVLHQFIPSTSTFHSNSFSLI